MFLRRADRFVIDCLSLLCKTDMDCAHNYEISREPELKISLENLNSIYMAQTGWHQSLKTEFKHMVRDRLSSKILSFEAGPALFIGTAIIHEMILSSFFYIGEISERHLRIHVLSKALMRTTVRISSKNYCHQLDLISFTGLYEELSVLYNLLQRN